MKKIFNILFYVVITAVLVFKAPAIYENFKRQNQPAPQASIKRLSGESGQVSKKYNVTGTPTVVFIDAEEKINWITTGLSPTLEYRIKEFL